MKTAISLRPRANLAPVEHYTDSDSDEEPALTAAPRRRPRKRTKHQQRESRAVSPPPPKEAADTQRSIDGEADDDSIGYSSDEAGDRPAKRPLVCGRTWLPAEDAVLLEAVAKYGSAWKQIAAAMKHLGTNRTTAMCRNRHQRIRAPLQPGKEGRNRCKRCGLIKRGHTCTNPEGEAAFPAALDAPLTPLLLSRPAPIAAAKALQCDKDALCTRGLKHRGLCSRQHTLAGEDSALLLPEQPILTPATGNAFNVDVADFLAHVNDPHLHGGATPPDSPPAASSANEQHITLAPPAEPTMPPSSPIAAAPHEVAPAAGAAGAPPANLGASVYLASSAPPPVSGKLPARSERSFGSISLSMLNDVDLSELVDVDMADFERAADAALTSKSFADHAPPPQLKRETTPTTLAGEGDDTAADTPPLDELPCEIVTDAADRANMSTPLPTPLPAPLPAPLASPPAELVARHLQAPPVGAPYQAASSFDVGLADTSLTPPRAASPIKHVPIELPAGAPPPLMPLPSWSRAPSFSFAEPPVDLRAALLVRPGVLA